MRIVGQSVGGDALLIDVGEGMGRVLDLRHRRFFAPLSIQSIIARGYWQDYDGEQNLDERLEGVQDDLAGTSA